MESGGFGILNFIYTWVSGLVDSLLRCLSFLDLGLKNAEGLRTDYYCAGHFLAYRFSNQECWRAVDLQ